MQIDKLRSMGVNSWYFYSSVSVYKRAKITYLARQLTLFPITVLPNLNSFLITRVISGVYGDFILICHYP